MQISISFQDNVTPKINKLIGKISNFEPELTKIGNNQFVSEKTTFDSGGRPIAWEKSKKTKGKHPNGLTMIESQDLLKSLTVRGAKGNIFVVTGNSLTFGTNIATPNGFGYATFHQFEGTKGIKRPTLVLMPEDKQFALKTLMNGIINSLK